MHAHAHTRVLAHSIQAAANFLVEADDLKAKEAAFQQRKAELAEQRRLEDIAKERNRQAIIER